MTWDVLNLRTAGTTPGRITNALTIDTSIRLLLKSEAYFVGEDDWTRLIEHINKDNPIPTPEA